MKRLLALLLSVALLTGCGATVDSSGSSDQSADQSVVAPVPEPEPEPVVSRLMVAGDIMNHDPQIEDAYIPETVEYSYTHMFAEAAPQLAVSDYALANLETTMAGGPNYSGYPNFNAPDGLADSIREVGLDLVSTGII